MRWPSVCRARGIEFRRIDGSRPLASQGPFDVVIHKVRDSHGNSMDAWDRDLEAFAAANPQVHVVDSPAAIRRLSSRASMLQVLPCCLQLPQGIACIPRQLIVHADDALDATMEALVARAGLSLPLVAKPMLVDGSLSSHRLALVTEEQGLGALQAPLVLQEFYNHGGVLFKVNVVGQSVTVVERNSLPDLDGGDAERSWDSDEEAEGRSGSGGEDVVGEDAAVWEGGVTSVISPDERERRGVRLFERISSAYASEGKRRSGALAAVCAPPEDLVRKLAAELRERLGLQLFNFDLIRARQSPDRYYVIDINYFPGFSKLPDYHTIFTQFLLGLCAGERPPKCSDREQAIKRNECARRAAAAAVQTSRGLPVESQ